MFAEKAVTSFMLVSLVEAIIPILGACRLGAERWSSVTTGDTMGGRNQEHWRQSGQQMVGSATWLCPAPGCLPPA